MGGGGGPTVGGSRQNTEVLKSEWKKIAGHDPSPEGFA